MIDFKELEVPKDGESAMTDMLTRLLHPLVDLPEKTSIEVLRRDDGATFVVQVEPCDMEKFIGRNARTGHSLQTIVSAVGTKSHKRFSIIFRENTETTASEADLLPQVTRT